MRMSSPIERDDQVEESQWEWQIEWWMNYALAVDGELCSNATAESGCAADVRLSGFWFRANLLAESIVEELEEGTTIQKSSLRARKRAMSETPHQRGWAVAVEASRYVPHSSEANPSSVSPIAFLPVCSSCLTREKRREYFPRKSKLTRSSRTEVVQTITFRFRGGRRERRGRRRKVGRFRSTRRGGGNRGSTRDACM